MTHQTKAKHKRLLGVIIDKICMYEYDVDNMYLESARIKPEQESQEKKGINEITNQHVAKNANIAGQKQHRKQTLVSLLRSQFPHLFVASLIIIFIVELARLGLLHSCNA